MYMCARYVYVKISCVEEKPLTRDKFLRPSLLFVKIQKKKDSTFMFLCFCDAIFGVDYLLVHLITLKLSNELLYLRNE